MESKKLASVLTKAEQKQSISGFIHNKTKQKKIVYTLNSPFDLNWYSYRITSFLVTLQICNKISNTVGVCILFQAFDRK